MSYGMFTDMGNGLVGCIVQMAVEYQLGERAVINTLKALAEDEVYKEASDTAVREAVLYAIDEARFGPVKEASVMVQDLVTGEIYDPQEKFDEMLNKPEIMDVMKRLKVR